MSLYGMMRTGSSGMSAQANRLSTVSDNIANSNTTGYKRSSTEFSSLLLPSTNGNYNSGAVQTDVRYAITEQGALTYTSSNTDLAISGGGFFVVQNAQGAPYLTRSGSFVPNEKGELVNAGGYTLMGYPYTTDNPTPVVNGFDGLATVKVGSDSLVATASTQGVFSANLDSAETDVDTGTYTLPSALAANDPITSDNYTHKSSLKAYDSLGNEILFDMYFSKTADNTWEVAVFNQADFDTSTGSYATAALASMELDFDPTTGKLDAGMATTTLSIPTASLTNMPDGFDFDLAGMTQLAYNFSVQDASVNGNAPSEVKGVQISTEGIVYAQYDNGDLLPVYRLAMATVESPDELNVISGNVYSASVNSGVTVLGFPGNSGFGNVISGALESSNVDIAEELTRMIESQRTYTANSKVFQTGSDLLDVLVNLKR